MCCTINSSSLHSHLSTLFVILPEIRHTWPLSEDNLCRFVSVLAHDYKLKHRSIKAYLSGLRFMHIQHGRGKPQMNLMSRLEYTLQGIKRAEAMSGVASCEASGHSTYQLAMKTSCSGPPLVWGFSDFFELENLLFCLNRLMTPRSTSAFQICRSMTTGLQPWSVFASSKARRTHFDRGLMLCCTTWRSIAQPPGRCLSTQMASP